MRYSAGYIYRRKQYGCRVKQLRIVGSCNEEVTPLPTGVWTGSLIAALLGIRFKRTFPVIFVGNLIAGILVMLLSLGAVNVIVG